MKPDMNTPPAADLAEEKPAQASAGEVCIPSKALAMPDENEQMANPTPGDPVTFQVEGKVTRVVGENTYVKPTSVNGEPLDAKAAEEKPAEQSQDDKDYSELQG